MKKLSTLMMCLLVMMVASLSAKAQEITVNLIPGWTWIGYPYPETASFDQAFGTFTPMTGDVIKSLSGHAIYNGTQWRGNINELVPGEGYKYYSNRSETVSVVFGHAAAQLTVTTTIPTDITAISATGGGYATSNDGSYIFVKGICWADHQNPVPNDDFHTENGNGVGSFSVSMTDLTPNTVYYVRAYAVSTCGIFYGNQLTFTTLEDGSIAPIGAIDGLFSVSASKQVYFSQGNLQYIGSAATPYWQFAENQWDYYGDVSQGSTNQNVDRDLFGWGTSGYNHGANCYQPWSTSENTNDYHAYGQYMYNLNDQTGQADWGYNPISNGGDQPNQWHTLSRAEWVYVFNTRSTVSGIRYAKAKVNDVNGMILLPDDWDANTYNLNNTNTSNVSFSSNEITAADWSVMEQAGAVFLPAAGGRYGIALRRVGSDGYYWSASYINSGRACVVNFNDSSFGPEYANNRYDGFSVRLVRVAQ